LSVFHIGRVTFLEALRHPLGLMLSLLLSILILFSPAFTSFNLGNGAELLRSNLLSTLLLGGVAFCSISSTNLIQREIKNKTILSLMSRPVNLPQIYLGKLLGTFSLLSLFCFVISSVCWFSLVIGTPDTASTKLNMIPAILLAISLISLTILSIALNYALGTHLISFLYKSWLGVTPFIILGTLLLSPIMELPLPELSITMEFVKAAILVYFLILVVAAFSIAIGTLTGPLVNLILCIAFLMIGLMIPGLESAWSSTHPIWSSLVALCPDFHVFWMAEMVNLGHPISARLLLEASTYAITLIVGFSSLGIYILMRRDFS
jgi:ABC-2 type transport system permease protein